MSCSIAIGTLITAPRMPSLCAAHRHLRVEQVTNSRSAQTRCAPAGFTLSDSAQATACGYPHKPSRRSTLNRVRHKSSRYPWRIRGCVFELTDTFRFRDLSVPSSIAINDRCRPRIARHVSRSPVKLWQIPIWRCNEGLPRRRCSLST